MESAMATPTLARLDALTPEAMAYYMVADNPQDRE